MKEDRKERSTELEKLILKHKALYYQGRAEITDYEYDLLEEELRGIDPNHYILSSVGFQNKKENVHKIKHSVKMLSLNKTYDVKELLNWAGSESIIYMHKIDGMSCSLHFDQGLLKRAVTRGDGQYGEDITANAIWVNSVKKRIKYKGKVEIRGEIYCEKESFQKLSLEMQALNLEPPQSIRNIVPGLMGRKDNISLCRYLKFLPFDALDESKNYNWEKEKFSFLEEELFSIPEVNEFKDGTEKEVLEIVNKSKEFFENGSYLIDGLVFVLSDVKKQKELGSTAHHPRYKLAFKYLTEVKSTIIKEILWSLSRNGILTPIALIEPTELSGAKISRVSLHNLGMVKDYNLKAGDKIEITRSGEVIPKFLNVLKSHPGKYTLPQNCPICGKKLLEEDIRLFCENSNCSKKKLKEILHFTQKVGIENISEKRLQQIISEENISGIDDLFHLKKDDLLALEGFKEKLASKIIDSIKESIGANLGAVLSGLGIKGGGENTWSKVISEGYTSIDKVLHLKLSDLLEIEGFAEKSATDLLASLDSKKDLIKRLRVIGFMKEEVELDSQPKTGGKLAGKKVCVTGKLEKKRSEIEKLLKLKGAKVQSTVNKETAYLVCNDTNSNSSKLRKAKEFGIQIIDENTLMELIDI